MSYILLTTPLVLHADPILPSHAVTRQYVDAKRLNVNASWFTTGTISAARMPALGGDVSSVAGSGTVSLNVNGAIAGTYTKVTVDATGRVTGGGALVAADIASVSWTKITSGKPTTAAGYGITNLISLSGGTASGNVSSTATPSAALHAVTKGYVDNAISGVVSASLSIGDVIRKPVAIGPTGFLRCNGAIVNNTTYAGLFTVIGGIYNRSNTANSGGRPWRLQYDFNLQDAGASTLSNVWTTPSSVPEPTGLSRFASVVTSNRIYTLGGYIGQNGYTTANVYTTTINADGTLGTWTTSTPLPVTLGLCEAIVISKRVYLLGGIIASSTYNPNVYTAPINADGTLGAWTTSTPLPELLCGVNAVLTSTKLHVLGGNLTSGYASSTVYTASINTDGTLGAWTTSTPLPAGIISGQTVVTKNRVYILGGARPGENLSSVYTAPINMDGTLGTWTTSTPLPGAIVAPGNSFVTNSYVYVFGVTPGGGGGVYRAAITSSGIIDTWVSFTLGIGAVYGAQVVISNSRVYVMAGIQSNYPSTTIYATPFLGGFNDYTNYTAQITTAATDFTLPDFSSLEEYGINYFIKF